MKKICILPLVLAVVAINACIQEEGVPEKTPEVQSEDRMTTVNFTIRTEAPAFGTKSSVAPMDEDAIYDLLLIAYSHGELIDFRKIQDPLRHPEELALSLQKDHEHQIYALANGFSANPPADEKSMREMTCRAFKTVKELQKGLPMVWEGRFVPVSSDSATTVDIRLRRLVAKVILSMDTSGMKGYHCDKIRLRQVPGRLYPFRNTEGCKAATADEVMDGDSALFEEAAVLPEGKTLVFYTLENRQGKLIQGNKDPWKKIPDEMSGAQKTCTYLEVRGHFEAPSIHRGSVLLRFYLGRNAWDDFNVDGNALHRLHIIGSDKHLNQPSWKLEADTSIDPSRCKAWISEDSMHRDGLLYKGEHFKTEFTMDPELEHYLKMTAGKLKLRFFPETGSGASGKTSAIDFQEVRQGKTFYSLGTCMSDASGDIWLCDSNEEKIVPLLQSIRIITPLMSSNLDATSNCNVNESLPINICFTDLEGKDLSTNPLGFSSGLFDVSLDVSSPWKELVRLSHTGKAWSWQLECPNDGKDHERNLQLARSISEETPVQLTATEKNSGQQLAEEVKLSHTTIYLNYECMKEGYTLNISNGSCIPLQITDNFCIRSNTLSSSEQFRRTEIVDHYLRTSEEKHWLLLVKSFDTIYETIFSSSHRRTVGNETGCTPHEGTDAQWNHRFLDYDGGKITEAALYHFRNPKFTKLLIDVSLMGYGIKPGKIVVSSKSPWAVWDYCGHTLYSAKKFLKQNDIGILSKFNPLRIEEIKETGEVCLVETCWDSGKQQLMVRCGQAQPGLYLDIDINGQITGEAELSGNKSGIKYHQEAFNSEVKNIELSVGGQAIDRNQISEALRRILSKTFIDHRPEGDVEVPVKPTGLYCTIKVKLSEQSEESCYGVEFSDPPARYEYYDGKDGKQKVIDGNTKIYTQEFYDITSKK